MYRYALYATAAATRAAIIWLVASALSLPEPSLAQQVVTAGYPMWDDHGPYGITSGPDGAVWFTENDGQRIGRITTAAAYTYYPLPDPASYPIGIATGSDGALWFTENGTSRIGRITTAGVISEYPIPAPGGRPEWITAGPDGALWFGEPGAVGRITTDGAITEYPIPSGSSPAGITAGPDGALWFTENGLLSIGIGRITVTGAVTEYPVPSTSGEPTLEMIATGPDGALWFTQSGNVAGAIGRITTAGAVTMYIPADTNDWPIGITAGPDGALWFTETGNTSLASITTSGVITEYRLHPGTNPFQIVLGPDGQLWLTANNFPYYAIEETFFPTADLMVSPAQGCFKKTLTFTGTGFTPGETVQVYRSGVGSEVLASGAADAGGSFTASAACPESPDGVRAFVGVGQTSGELGAATLHVPTLIVANPKSGTAGSSVTVQGYGFGPFDEVNFSWNVTSSRLGITRADVQGTFNRGAAFTFTVPAGTAPGQYSILANGKDSGVRTSVTFTVE